MGWDRHAPAQRLPGWSPAIPGANGVETSLKPAGRELVKKAGFVYNE
jgi:hypothetical protein